MKQHTQLTSEIPVPRNQGGGPLLDSKLETSERGLLLSDVAAAKSAVRRELEN